MSGECVYCAGEGWRTEYVGSRFVGTNPQAHSVTVRCWSCGGSGKTAAAPLPAEKETPNDD